MPGAVLLPRPPLPETLRGTTLPTGRLADTGETPRGKGAIQRGGGEGRATPAPAARPWAAVASPLPALALQTLGMSSAGRGEPRRVSLGAGGSAALARMDVTCPGSLRLPARCLPAGLHPFQQKEHLLAVDRGWQSRRRLTGHVPGRRLRLEDRRAGLFLRTGSEAPSVFTPTCAPLS